MRFGVIVVGVRSVTKGVLGTWSFDMLKFLTTIFFQHFIGVNIMIYKLVTITVLFVISYYVNACACLNLFICFCVGQTYYLSIYLTVEVSLIPQKNHITKGLNFIHLLSME